MAIDTNIQTQLIIDRYTSIQDCVSSIRQSPSQLNLEDLRKALDKYFIGSECLSVSYTQNTDKLAFFVYAFPKVSGEDVINIMFNGAKFVVTQYDLELDSRLFGDDIQLTVEEITALIVHDISNLISNAAPAMKVRNWLDNYLIEHNDILKVPQSVHYRGLLAYGFADSMRKITTIFEKDHFTMEDETTIDYDTVAGEQDTPVKRALCSAFNKINALLLNYNREVINKFITLQWVLRIYKDLARNRIPGLMGIKHCISISPSKIERRELKNMAARISRIDDESILESAMLPEEKSLVRNINESFITRKTYNILEDADEDYMLLLQQYESDLVNDPDGIPDLVNTINSRMSNIQDLVDKTVNDKKEYKLWNDMYKRYGQLRADIVNNKTLYNANARMKNIYQGSIDI